MTQTSIPYLIRHASVIQILDFHLYRPTCRFQQVYIGGKKIVAHSALEPATFGLQA